MKLITLIVVLAVTLLAGCAVVPLDHTHTVVVDEGTVVEEQMIVE